MKTKVLAICNKGRTRSRYLARYLKEKGYTTKWGGVSKTAVVKLTKEKIRWTDIIIVSDKLVMKKLRERFRLPKKKIIILNVYDGAQGHGKEAKKIMQDALSKVRRKYVFPTLKKRIDRRLT
jgi:predicted protein tyrosine phosphatase